jgi:hypothetical protein
MKWYYVASRIKVLAVAVALSAIIACQGAQVSADEASTTPKSAKEAMKISQNTKQYLFLIFYDKKDSLYDQMKAAIVGVMAQSDAKILIYEAAKSSEADAGLIAQYKIDRAPMPLLMVIGPNGAVLGGFPKSVTADKLAKSLVPPLTMDVLKSIQQQKMAVVLLQNSKTKFNAEASKTANDLAYDKRLLGSVDVIKADPSDPKNRDFLANAQIASATATAFIVLITPPGVVTGVFPGNTTKNSIMSSLQAASSGACAGGQCGPGGCK